MSSVQVIFYIQLILFIILVSTCFYVTQHKSIGNIPKWIIAVCSITILALSDKLKLIAAIGMVAILYLIKYFHHKKQKHGTNSDWELDS